MSAEKKRLPKEKAESRESVEKKLEAQREKTSPNKFDAKQYYYHPPNEILLEVSLPKNLGDDKAILNYLWKHFHIDVTACERCDPSMRKECKVGKEKWEKCDNYMNLYYNSDLRSYMGEVEEENIDNPITLRILPTYYAKDWEKEYWIPLLEHSSILEVNGEPSPYTSEAQSREMEDMRRMQRP
jgi:hypothetical protein